MRHAPLPVVWLTLAAVLAGPPAVARAQAWNSDSALALVRRATLRRSEAASDTALRDYKAQAHGFLFFLGQFGEGLTAPPRLIRADQLELEVYWKAPGLSKQRIIGWRNKADLPTDIVYHRDHLGIIQNNFGPGIRLGEGDEVRDVPHPLAFTGGPALYDFALGDTTSIALPQRTVRVVALLVRPKDFTAPGIIGTLYVDVATADLVRMAFNFTPHAYLEPDLEDVSVELDNALWEGRFWLPYRQQIEIRRRATWLDIPARGIIRSRWEVDGYTLNVGLARSWFLGEEITALPPAERDSFPWTQPLAAAVQGVGPPLEQHDLAEVRSEVERIAGRHVLTGLKARRLGARSVSDIVHANRVEGLAVGGGGVWRIGGESRELRALASYGFADERWKGLLEATARRGGSRVAVELYRSVRDVGTMPVIAPLLNSFSAQEFGDDYGDYYLASGGRLTYGSRLSGRDGWSASVGRETPQTLIVRAEPASGTFRPNPPLGGPGVDLIEMALYRRAAGFIERRDALGTLSVEGGRLDGGTTYARVEAQGEVLVPVGVTRALVRVQAGAATTDLPAHRSFVLGGRGTLLGDDFRVWGGRRMWLVHLEWRTPVPFVPVRVGPSTETPRSIMLAPFVATGWADRPVAGTPWGATPGARVTLGLAAEWLGLFRLEAGYGVQTRRIHVAFDLTRALWDVL